MLPGVIRPLFLLSTLAIRRSVGMATFGTTKYPIVCGEDVMRPKAHGTTDFPVMSNLRWGCDEKTANRICSHNRHYAEHSGYWQQTSFLKEEHGKSEVKFYDSVSGKLLYTAPRGRTWAEFVAESKSHGWPSFRDAEVEWENARCLANGEMVSLAGTHLGHNLPDRKGNRYCINLVCIAGREEGAPEAAAAVDAAAGPADADGGAKGSEKEGSGCTVQ